MLYLVPQNFIFFNEQPSVVNRIPFDEIFWTLQNNSNIRNFNVTLTKYENEIYEFINPLASPSAGAHALKYGDVNTETTFPGEVKGLIIMD